jgi:hypothetical protein
VRFQVASTAVGSHAKPAHRFQALSAPVCRQRVRALASVSARDVCGRRMRMRRMCWHTRVHALASVCVPLSARRRRRLYDSLPVSLRRISRQPQLRAQRLVERENHIRVCHALNSCCSYRHVRYEAAEFQRQYLHFCTSTASKIEHLESRFSAVLSHQLRVSRSHASAAADRRRRRRRRRRSRPVQPPRPERDPPPFRPPRA